MKVIIKELLDELMDRQNMKGGLKFIHFKKAVEKADSLRPLSSFIDWAYGRDKEIIKDYSPNYLPIESEYMQKDWQIIFNTTPALSELIKLKDNKIQWADNLTEEEVKEIKAYITERYLKESPFVIPLRSRNFSRRKKG